MRQVNDSWKSCLEQLLVDYEHPIKNATQQLTDTYKKYSDQHDAFVSHAENTIKTSEVRIVELEDDLKKALEAPPPPPPTPPPQVDFCFYLLPHQMLFFVFIPAPVKFC